MLNRIVAVAVAAVLTAAPAFPRGGESAAGREPRTRTQEPAAVRDAAALRRSILELMTAVMASGFIKADVSNSLEIENNFYGFFAGASDGVRGAYEKGSEGRDVIAFERGLLTPGSSSARKAEGPGVPNPRVLQTIVHELFHDFWFNRLTPDERRAFTAETKRLLAGFAKAGTRKARRRVLASWAYADPQDEDARVWEELWQARSKYSSPSYYGPELFSFMAALSFAGAAVIPAPVRPFYADLISEPYLQRAE